MRSASARLPAWWCAMAACSASPMEGTRHSRICPAPMTLHLEAAGITHRGTVRENNEDCLAIGFWVSQETLEAARRFEHALAEPFACIVADGMGGHNDGERASLLVARSLARRLATVGPGNVAASVRAVNAELYAQLREQ